MARNHDDLRTRRRILELLKLHGPQDAQALAAQLDVTPMAVRQHLYPLQEQKLVDTETRPSPVGRPAKLWRLTAATDRYFPDAHADLAVGLIQSMTETFGAKGLAKLVQARAAQQAADYARRMPRRASLKRRLEALADIRTQEGYMAELIEEDGAFLLVENHCPVCSAARACTGLCSAELQVFQEVLGERVHIERTEHILEGARRCAYRVRRKRTR